MTSFTSAPRPAAHSSLPLRSSQFSFGSPVTDIAVDPNDWHTVFATDYNHVYKSSNAGGTWEDVTGNLTSTGSGSVQDTQGSAQKTFAASPSCTAIWIIPSSWAPAQACMYRICRCSANGRPSAPGSPTCPCMIWNTTRTTTCSSPAPWAAVFGPSRMLATTSILSHRRTCLRCTAFRRDEKNLSRLHRPYHDWYVLEYRTRPARHFHSTIRHGRRRPQFRCGADDHSECLGSRSPSFSGLSTSM